MATPSKSTVMGWIVAFASLAPTIESIAKGIRDNTASLYKTIDGMNWSGTGRAGADGRIERERTQMGVVADAFDDLATACRNGQSRLEPMVASARQTVTDLSGDFYQVNEDWSVDDMFNYAAALVLARGNQDQTDQINQLQTDRSNEAANQTVALQRLAADIGVADDSIATALSTALASIQQLTPISAGLNPVVAQQDLDAWKNGKATPDQIERLRLATQLTPDQLQDLLNGKDVDIPQERYDYLRSVLRDMDGMSVSDISKLGDKLPPDQQETLKSSLADAMQLMSNPQVETAGNGKTEDQGGMAVLPTQVQTLLKDNPVRRSEKYPSSEFAGSFIDVPREDDFNKFLDLMGKGNPGLDQGSDIDRGLLKQGAELAAAGQNIVTGPKLHGTNELADRMLTQAGGDRLAVHDLLYGTNMQVTVTEGGHYDAPSHVGDLLNHTWQGHEDGVTKVIETAGHYATSPDPTVNLQSGEASWALANYAATHSQDLLHLDGGDHSIGMADPKMTKALGQTLASYIPSMVGVPDGMFGTHGFGEIDQANVKNIFAVVDSNKDAAVDFNRAAYVTIAQMNQDFGAHGGTDYALGEWAGKIDAAAQSGMQLELAGRKMDQATQLKYEQAVFDSVKDIAAFGGKHIPRLAFGGSAALPMGFSLSDFTELGVKVAAPEVKNWLFGAIPELGPNADLDGYGSQSKRFYNVIQGMTLTQGHPNYSQDPEIGRYFDGEGNLLSYEAIQKLNGKPETSLPIFNQHMKTFLPGLLAYEDGWTHGHDNSAQHPR